MVETGKIRAAAFMRGPPKLNHGGSWEYLENGAKKRGGNYFHLNTQANKSHQIREIRD